MQGLVICTLSANHCLRVSLSFQQTLFVNWITMALSWKNLQSLSLVFVISSLYISFVLSLPAQKVSSIEVTSFRHPKTLDMQKGMDMLRDMVQNGMAYRPVPPSFPSLKNLFKTNGTQLTWVPLGSILFNNNGKIIGG